MRVAAKLAIAAALPALGGVGAFIAPAPGGLDGRGAVLTSARRLPASVGPPVSSLRPPLSARRRLAPLTGLRCSSGAGLDAWLEDNGVRAACSLSSAGLVALKDLKEGEEACSVKVEQVCMTAASARAAFGNIADTVDPETAIALQVMLEKSKGASSAWAPWLASLPERNALDLPYFWSQADQQLLEGTSVLDAIEENQDAFQEEFDQLKEQGWDAKLPSSIFTLENYEWAVGIVSSRSVYDDKFPGQYILAPFVDAAFTGEPSSGKAELYYDGMFREPRVRVVPGVSGVRKGEVVGIDFGGKPLSKMMLNHGVARLGGGSDGAYEVSFSVSPMDKYQDDKLDILELNKMPEELTISFSASDYLTAEETAFLRLVCLQGSDAFLLESVFRNEVWYFMQEPVSPENEKMMLDTLIATCEGSLSGFATSDAQDREALANGSIREKRAAAVRLSEKAALKNTILILEEEMDTLDDKDYYQQRRLRELNLDRPLDESEIIDPDVDIRPESIGRLPGM
jgi:[ribulose-bisphosphate carboxylase]-lysine N-methyltransferase